MRVLCLSNRFYYRELKKEDVNCITYDLELYNKTLHKAYRLSYDMCFHHVSIKSLQKHLKELYGTSDYLPLSAIHEAKAVLHSTIEINKRMQRLYHQIIKNIQKKMNETNRVKEKYEKKLKKLIDKCKDGDYTEEDYLYEVQIVKPKIKELKNREKQLRFRKKRYEYKIVGLKKRVKQCCFGGSKNLKNDKEAYFFHRRNRMLIPGRRQGKYSNNLFKYHIDTETMQLRTTQKDVYLPITFHHHKEELIRAVSLPHNTPKKAVAYELRDYGEYFIIKAIIEVEDKHLEVNKTNGVIGLDINVDHFAMVETNEIGNIVGRKTIRYDLKNKTRNQRTHLLRNSIKEMIMYCKKQKKPLIIESLQFEETKSKMLYQNKRRNQQLSEFAYKKIKEMIGSRCYQDDVAYREVNPAYTSQIGRLKYAKSKGMSIHESASYVIARRGQGYKERINEEYKPYIKEEIKRYPQIKKWEYLSRRI